MTEGTVARGARGHAMVALLVGMSIMAIALTVALPVWQTAAKREKEAELIFRGQQYARAIMLFQRKYANTFPPNVDVLVRERFLRRKYKDPVTGEDFVTVGPGTPVPGQQQAAASGRAGQAGRGGVPSSAASAPSPSPAPVRTPPFNPNVAAPVFGQIGAGAAGRGIGIMGVASKSTDTSLRLYNGRDKYNEWVFVATEATTQAGSRSGGRAGEGGRGGPTPGGVRGAPAPGRGRSAPPPFSPPAGPAPPRGF